MSLLYNKILESVKKAIYESLFDDIDDDIISDDDSNTIIDNISNNYKFCEFRFTFWNIMVY